MVKKYITTIFILLCSVQMAQSQVLISLLFGDKLNSDKIKFGLEGGVNFANVTNLPTASTSTNFNIGFYFDFKLNENPNWYLHTGVIVKSTMGAKLEPYSLNDENLDELFAEGDVIRKLNYWNVPFLARYKFNNNIFIEAGPMLGIIYKGVDKFTNDVNGSELIYNNDVRKDHTRFDIGLEGGIGYQTEKFMNGMNFGARYYHGLLNSSIVQDANQKNTSYYIFVGLPIGAGEKAQAKKKAAAESRAKKKEEALLKDKKSNKKSKKDNK